jgi:hypothetical protein
LIYPIVNRFHSSLFSDIEDFSADIFSEIDFSDDVREGSVLRRFIFDFLSIVA